MARIGWTKLERIERTGHNGRSPQRRDTGFDRKCYLCSTVIPVGEHYLHGTTQVRAYRSVRDMGDTRGECCICARCLFPSPKE